jgi:uncharacterized OB-fold protein
MTKSPNSPRIYTPGAGKKFVPFMRDVFTIPTNSRQKPHLIGSVCEECEEYFFPKTGQKATCDNPFCPRSTSPANLSGRGKLLSATVMRSSVEGEGERASAVILLEEGIKINSVLIGWEGYQYLMVPGTPVELVLHEMGMNEEDEMVIGYAFRLVVGRKKPLFPEEEEKAASSKAGGGEKGAAKSAGAGKSKAPAQKAAKKKVVKKKAVKKKAKKRPAPKKSSKKKTTKKKAAKKKTAKKKVVKKKAKKPQKRKNSSPKRKPKRR